jgi:hypothetical protein
MTAPTTTAFTDADPCPRVVIDGTTDVDATNYTLWRAYDGTREPVRSAVNAPAAGGFTITDFEAPFGIAVTYQFESYDDTGAVIDSLTDYSDPLTLDVTDAWASDPLDPGTSMAWNRDGSGPVVMESGSLSGFGLLTTASTIEVIGSRLPMGQSNIRQAPSSVPIVLFCRTVDAANTVFHVVQQAMLMCLRVPADVPLLDPVMYLQIDSAVPTVFDDGRVRWTLTGTQVRGPSIATLIPVRTWQDVLNEASTWGGLLGLYATWRDVLKG